MTYLYGLHDPITNKPRYVGKANDPWKRYSCHLCDTAKTHKMRWVRSLLRKGLSPKLVIYAEVREEAWQEAERLLIVGFRQIGYDLTNTTDGGEGTAGRKHSEEAKRRIGQAKKGNTDCLGRIASEETRKKMSASARGNQRSLGHKHSRETKQWISAAKWGHSTSQETLQKMSAHCGHPQSDDTRKRISERMKIIWAMRKELINA